MPRFPFTFTKQYGVSGARGIIYTATQGDKPGTVNVTWSGNGQHSVTLNYAESDVMDFLDPFTVLDRWGGRKPKWHLLMEAPLVEQPKGLSFDGGTFNQARDGVRLTGQWLRVTQCMQDGQWRSLRDISSVTGDPEASVSARLRDLRKEKFGSQTVERKYIDKGLFEYRVLPKAA